MNNLSFRSVNGMVVLLDKVMARSDIRFMTYVILSTAPEQLFDKWVKAIDTQQETETTQSVWRIAGVVADYLEQNGDMF